MALIINDPYGGGQELISSGRSSIPLRETYSTDPRAINAQYSDQMRNVNQLVDALSGLSKTVGSVEDQNRKLETANAEAYVADVQSKLNSTDPVDKQLAMLRPDLNPWTRAAMSQIMARQQAALVAQTAVENMPPEARETPEKTQAYFDRVIQENASRVGGQPFYSAPFVATLRSEFAKRSGQLSAERTAVMTEAMRQDGRTQQFNAMEGFLKTGQLPIDPSKAPSPEEASEIVAFSQKYGINPVSATMLLQMLEKQATPDTSITGETAQKRPIQEQIAQLERALVSRGIRQGTRFEDLYAAVNPRGNMREDVRTFLPSAAAALGLPFDERNSTLGGGNRQPSPSSLAVTPQDTDRLRAKISYTLGPNRPDRPDEDVVLRAAKAVESVNPDWKIVVHSGGGEYGSDRHRAQHGYKAADIYVVDRDGKRINFNEHRQQTVQLFERLAAAGIKGLGFYGNNPSIHVDMVREGAWGPSKSSNTLPPELSEAISRGRRAGVSGGSGASATLSSFPAVSPSQYFGTNVATLPAGMRNNNIGNIKFSNWSRALPGAVGPSQNLDQGDPQVVFNSPEAGVAGAARLALNKYNGGMTNLNQLIAGERGWTEGNFQAAKNIAATMGISPTDDLKLTDEGQMQKFIRALALQEHGSSSNLFKNATIVAGVKAGMSDSIATSAGRQAAASSGVQQPSVSTDPANASLLSPDTYAMRLILNQTDGTFDKTHPLYARTLRKQDAIANTKQLAMSTLNPELLDAFPRSMLTPAEREDLANYSAAIRKEMQAQRDRIKKEQDEAIARAKVATETQLNEMLLTGKPIPQDFILEINRQFPDLAAGLRERMGKMEDIEKNPRASSTLADSLRQEMTAAFLNGTDPNEFRDANRTRLNNLTRSDYGLILKFSEDLRTGEKEMFNPIYQDMTRAFLVENFNVNADGLATPRPETNVLNPDAARASQRLQEFLVQEIANFASGQGRAPSTPQERIAIFKTAELLTLQVVKPTDPRKTGDNNNVDPRARSFNNIFGR